MVPAKILELAQSPLAGFPLLMRLRASPPLPPPRGFPLSRPALAHCRSALAVSSSRVRQSGVICAESYLRFLGSGGLTFLKLLKRNLLRVLLIKLEGYLFLFFEGIIFLLSMLSTGLLTLLESLTLLLHFYVVIEDVDLEVVGAFYKVTLVFRLPVIHAVKL